MEEILALLDKYHVKMIFLPPFTVKENPSDLNIQAWSEIILRYRSDPPLPLENLLKNCNPGFEKGLKGWDIDKKAKKNGNK